MNLGEDARLRLLLREARAQTKHIDHPKNHALTYHQDMWLAIRIMCEAILAESNEDASQ